MDNGITRRVEEVLLTIMTRILTKVKGDISANPRLAGKSTRKAPRNPTKRKINVKKKLRNVFETFLSCF